MVTEIADKGAPVKPGMTVADLLDSWIEFVTPLREPGTIRAHQSNAARLKTALGHMKVSKLTAQHLHVRHSLKHGLDGLAVVLRDTKTHQARKLALDPFASGVLKKHHSLALEWAKACDTELPEDGFIMTTDPGGLTPMKPDGLTRQFQRLTKQAKVKLRFHDLRRFTATQLLGANVDPRTVAGRLGHAYPHITMCVDAAFLEEKDEEAARIIGSLIEGLPAS